MRRLCRKLRSWREWVLTKIEHIQQESARWRLLFNLAKTPYSLLRTMGFSPQLAMTLLLAGGAVGSGVVVEKTLLSEYSFSRGDSGQYEAPSDVPVVYSDSDNTLRIDLGSTPIGEIIISDVTVGTAYAGSTLPVGETSTIIIGGLPTAGLFNETFLEVGYLTVDRWRCDQLILKEIEVHTLNVKYTSSDGQSISAVPGTPRNRGIGGGNRADSMTTNGSYYDQIKILAAAESGVNGKVDVMTLSNILSSGGSCVLSRIKAGTIDVLFNEVGNGDGFAAKDFVIQDTVIFQNYVSVGNVEVAIAPP